MTSAPAFTAAELEAAHRVLTVHQLTVWRLRRQGMSFGEMRWYLGNTTQACHQAYWRAERLIEEEMRERP